MARNDIQSLDKKAISTQLYDIIEDSNKMAEEIMSHLDIVLLKLDEIFFTKDLKNDIDGIRNNIFTTIMALQSQDFHRQKIERIINEIDPNNSKLAPSSKHIHGDDSEVLCQDQIAALVAQNGI